MSQREEELLIDIAGSDDSKAVAAALELACDFYIPRQRYVEAERVLLEVIGKQVVKDGLIVELRLGELYLKIKELPRAKRFLERVLESKDEELRNAAKELVKALNNQ